MSEIKLLPCPFCGGKAEIDRKGDRRQSTIYACSECSCRLETGEEFNIGTDWNCRASLSSAAVAELEPVGYIEKSDVEQLSAGNSVVVYVSDRDSLGIPIYLDPPPTSELEAENARLRDERYVAVAAMVRSHERAEAAEDRLAEAIKALDGIETHARLAPIHTSQVTAGQLMSSKLTMIREIASKAARHVREGE